MRDSNDFESAVQQLAKAIETNLPYVRNHTRLLMKAIKWQRSQRDPSFLLRGSDLDRSEQWLKQGRSRTIQRVCKLNTLQLAARFLICSPRLKR